MRLNVETGPLAGTVISLDRDPPAVLGSGADCAIRVQEAGVQTQHAVVKALKDQGFGIKALAPGVRLNGASIEASPLKDGDVIELGMTRIVFGEVRKRGVPRIAGHRIIDEPDVDGFSLEVTVRVERRDRDSLEHLCRYRRRFRRGAVAAAAGETEFDG